MTKLKTKDYELEKLIKRSVNYNVEHIFPVLIFRIRNLIRENTENSRFEFSIDKDKLPLFLQTLIEVIYEKYVEKKLEGLPTSLTTLVRSNDFYDIGSESYKTLIRSDSFKDLKETNFVYKYRKIV